MIDAQLGPNGQTGEWFRNRRLYVETDCEGAISCPATADRARIDDRLAAKRADGIVRISKLRDKEALSIAPDFAADLGGDPLVDRVGKILRHAIRAGSRAVIMRVVDVGNGGQF